MEFRNRQLHNEGESCSLLNSRIARRLWGIEVGRIKRSCSGPECTGTGPLSLGNSAKCLDRFEALARFSILDTPPERGFDDIVDLAAMVCERPHQRVRAAFGLIVPRIFPAGRPQQLSVMRTSVCAPALCEETDMKNSTYATVAIALGALLTRSRPLC